MVLLEDAGSGVRLEVEQRGRWTRFELTLTGAPRDEREAAAVSLRVFAELLAHRLPGRVSGC